MTVYCNGLTIPAFIRTVLGLMDVGFVLMLLTILITTAYDPFTWTGTSLKTLEMVLGPMFV